LAKDRHLNSGLKVAFCTLVVVVPVLVLFFFDMSDVVFLALTALSFMASIVAIMLLTGAKDDGRVFLGRRQRPHRAQDNVGENRPGPLP
jgi:hypothetical protein